MLKVKVEGSVEVVVARIVKVSLAFGFLRLIVNG